MTAGKQAAARAAAGLITTGMKVGLGTGSTATHLVSELIERSRSEQLDATYVATSQATQKQAEEGGLRVLDLKDAGLLDIVIDGADEIDPRGQLIKGGGGAAVRELIVAMAARRYVVIATTSKQVEVLGLFPLPIFVLPHAHEVTIERIAEICPGDVGLRAPPRSIVDEHGLMIVDAHFGPSITNPASTRAVLLDIAGVVDVGLFIDIADTAILGQADGGVTTIEFSRRHR